MWSCDAPAWLFARPIAHRGLHDAGAGVAENGLAAARRAMVKNYSIECDVQLSRDGEAIVFHDWTLGRLLGLPGEIGGLTAKEIGALAYPSSGEPVATLADLLAVVGGRVPLVIELKSRFDGSSQIAKRVAELAQSYAGPIALKSFDPQLLLWLRRHRVGRPLGLVAQARYAAADWPGLDMKARKALGAFIDMPLAAPDFLSWHAGDLPHAVPQLCRTGMGMKLMVWTVRSMAQRDRAAEWADQIVFEGFEP